MAVAAVAAVASGIVSAFSSFSKGRAQRRLAEERARQKRLQQLEIQRRNESEINLLKDQASGAVGEAVARYAGSGIDVGSAATSQARMQSYENLGRTILNKEIEAKFKISQLSAEERWEIKQGKSMYTSGLLEGFGTLVSTGLGVAKNLGGAKSADFSFGESFTDAGFDPDSVSNIG